MNKLPSRKAATDVSSLFVVAILPKLQHIDNASVVHVSFTLNVDTNVLEILDNIHNRLVHESDKHDYKTITYWTEKIEQFKVNMPNRRDDQFTALCDLVDIRYITWNPIPSEDSPIPFNSRIVLINDGTVYFKKVWELNQEMYKSCMYELPSNSCNEYFICYERCNEYLKLINTSCMKEYGKILKFRRHPYPDADWKVPKFKEIQKKS